MNDEKNQRLIFLGVIAVSTVLFFFFILISTRGRSTRETQKKDSSVTTTSARDRLKALTPSTKKHAPSDYRPTQSGHAVRPVQRATGAVLSTDEAGKIEERIQRLRQRAQESNYNRIFEKANDDSLNPREQENYRLKANVSYVQGLTELRRGNPQAALSKFFDAMEDEHASPISKYLITRYMKRAASKLKDFELYLDIARIEAELIANEDLSLLGVEKSNSRSKWLDEQEMYYKAMTDRSEFNAIVTRRIGSEMRNPREREEKILNEQIERFRRRFRGIFDET